MIGLRTKLLSGLAGLLGILLAVTLLGNSVLTRYSESIQRLLAEDYDSAAACQAMKESLERIVHKAQMRAWDARPVDGAIATTHAADDPDVIAFERELRLQSAIADVPGEREATEKLAASWRALLAEYQSVLDPSLSDARRHAIVMEDILPRTEEVRADAQRIIGMNLSELESGRGAAQAMTRRAQWTMHVLAVMAIAVAGGIVLLAGVTVLRPLRALEESARQIARGDLELRVPVRATDEVGQLARAFNDMAAQLREFKRIDREKLARTQRTTQLAIDSLPDAVLLFDPLGTIELANETAGRLFAVKPGMKVDELPIKWMADLHRQALTDAVPQRAPAYAAAMRVVDGEEERFFLPRTYPILDEARVSVIGSAIVLVDVSDLRRLDDMKNHLLATTAHELKTPLTSMRMVMHLIGEERLGPLNDRQRELVVAATADADRLHRIVETLLDMDRIRSGRSLMELRPVLGQELVQSCVARWRAKLHEHGLTLRVEVPQRPVTVRADADRMQHVIANLLDNAIRFTPTGGAISVTLRPTDDHSSAAHFVVSDTGSGVPEALQYRVFERFFRAPGQRGETGTGLGLAIVKEIIEAHGGRVWLESREGRGTSVHFVLPSFDPPAREMTSASRTATPLVEQGVRS